MIGEYYKNLPKKRMGAGMILFNKNNEILIVKPCYKDHWSIPGGSVDENESPKEACVRETKEEINIAIDDLKFLCIAYYANEFDPIKGESLQFMFYGGIINNEQISKIKLADGEISEYKFLKIDEALPLFNKKSQDWIFKSLEALKNNSAFYLEYNKREEE